MLKILIRKNFKWTNEIKWEKWQFTHASHETVNTSVLKVQQILHLKYRIPNTNTIFLIINGTTQFLECWNALSEKNHNQQMKQRTTRTIQIHTHWSHNSKFQRSYSTANKGNLTSNYWTQATIFSIVEIYEHKGTSKILTRQKSCLKKLNKEICQWLNNHPLYFESYKWLLYSLANNCHVTGESDAQILRFS